MSPLLVKPHAPDIDGGLMEVTPQSAGWKHVGFKLHRLTKGQTLSGGEQDRECCLVVLSGDAAVRVGDQDFGSEFVKLAGRKNVFEDAAPGAVYAPAGCTYEITALTDIEVALCTAPGKPGGSTGKKARVITADSMSREVRGQGTNTRYVRNILPQTEAADGLLVVEVITPGGNWSSYPPHKHDTPTVGEETALEEVYYHRINPSQGFAFQRVYTDDRSLDETICVEDGDLVMVPRGYHPVGAAHGYDLYYLNVMAGPNRHWIFRNDPAHDWIVRKQ